MDILLRYIKDIFVFTQQVYKGIFYLAAIPGRPALNLNQGILKGEYHCAVDLLFDWFGISCMTTDNFCFLFANQSNKRLMVQ
jgi:hypothetical protein